MSHHRRSKDDKLPTVKVTVSLPQPVADWLENVAQAEFIAPSEYLRRLLIDRFMSCSEDGASAVYFAQDDGDLIKIGVSSVLLMRQMAFQQSSSEKLSILGVIKYKLRSEAFLVERQLKRQFKHLHVRGQWYRGDLALRQYIEANVVPLTIHGEDRLTAPEAKSSTRRKSGYKGVYAYGKRWAAVLSHQGSQQRLGVCDSPDEAARLYDAALVARAGGDPAAAVNFQPGHDDAATEAPYIRKLSHGEALSDIEWATWAHASGPSAGPAPVDDQAPLVQSSPKRLRRSAVSLPRPSDAGSENDRER